METRTQRKLPSLGVEFAASKAAFIPFLLWDQLYFNWNTCPYQTQLKACDILLEGLRFG